MASSGTDEQAVPTVFERYAGVPVPMPAERPPRRQEYPASRDARGDRSTPVADIGHADPAEAHWSTCSGQRRSYPLIGWSMPSHGEDELELVGTYDGLTMSMRRMPDPERQQTQNMRGPEHIEPYNRNPYRDRIEQTPIEEVQFVNDMNSAGVQVGLAEQRDRHVASALQTHKADTLETEQEHNVPIDYGNNNVREMLQKDAQRVIRTNLIGTTASLRAGGAGGGENGAQTMQGAHEDATSVNGVTPVMSVMRSSNGGNTLDATMMQPTVEVTLDRQKLHVVATNAEVSTKSTARATVTERKGRTPIAQVKIRPQSLAVATAQPSVLSQRISKDAVTSTLNDRGSVQAMAPALQVSGNNREPRPAVPGTTPRAQVSVSNPASRPEQGQAPVAPEIPGQSGRATSSDTSIVVPPRETRLAQDTLERKWDTNVDAHSNQQPAQTIPSNRELAPQMTGAAMPAQVALGTERPVEPISQAVGSSDDFVTSQLPPIGPEASRQLPPIQNEPKNPERHVIVAQADVAASMQPRQPGPATDVVSKSTIPIPYQIGRQGVSVQ